MFATHPSGWTARLRNALALLKAFALLEEPSRRATHLPCVGRGAATRAPGVSPDAARTMVVAPDAAGAKAVAPDAARAKAVAPDTARAKAVAPDTARAKAIAPDTARTPRLAGASERPEARHRQTRPHRGPLRPAPRTRRPGTVPARPVPCTAPIRFGHGDPAPPQNARWAARRAAHR
jgi:hypothetical protein